MINLYMTFKSSKENIDYNIDSKAAKELINRNKILLLLNKYLGLKTKSLLSS